LETRERIDKEDKEEEDQTKEMEDIGKFLKENLDNIKVEKLGVAFNTW